MNTTLVGSLAVAVTKREDSYNTACNTATFKRLFQFIRMISLAGNAVLFIVVFFLILMLSRIESFVNPYLLIHHHTNYFC